MELDFANVISIMYIVVLSYCVNRYVRSALHFHLQMSVS